MSLLSLVARFSRSAVRTLRPRFFSLTLQRNKKAEHTTSSSIYNLPPSASKFKLRDIDLLRVGFKPASSENAVIPDVEVTKIPDKYVCPDISSHILGNPYFDVENIEGLTDKRARTFFMKLHNVVMNGLEVIGTNETFTDTLVDNLLRIAKLDDWPLMIRNHPLCKLYIEDDPCVSSEPEFVVGKRKMAVIVVDDKHLKNVGGSTGFGETQIAVEILACGSENIRSIGSEEHTDQILWAIRVISSYVTFYKAVIPAAYWVELENGLPNKQKFEIERWPIKNGLRTGFDLAEPDGRRTVLTALVKIRESLLQEDKEEDEQLS
ncbi:41_t:CDS:2 [Ambispora leptoticha]|uniref:41_t:CDS:1 n=1 Tax=Ambispora leptoticha TaxID=144679 RepID=A0A9N9BP07_9GLOM|nr:41_t:CDS:2 [Ambispora leptoticha]